MDSKAIISEELGLTARAVMAVLDLFADGGTVPFIARYRKEATGGLDEVQIHAIEERSRYLSELDKRRETILATIEEQGKLGDDLRAQLEACRSKTELEDFYLPYRPKRKTRAEAARGRGLEPLAQRIVGQPPSGDPEQDARAFVNPEKDVPDVAAALAGARDIVAEMMAERADLRGLSREFMQKTGKVVSKVIKKAIADGQPTRFMDYYEFSEPVSRIPSHRFLAIQRGEREGILRARIEIEPETLAGRLRHGMRHRGNSPWGEQMVLAVADGQKRLLGPAVEKDVLSALKEKSDLAAIEVFAENLKNLLLAAPLGTNAVLGIDPGFRTGCKCAALDATGTLLEYQTIFPFEKKRAEDAAKTICDLAARHGAVAIAVGNGTASRETMDFAREAIKGSPAAGAMVVSVSEAGASIYSASEIARDEFPDLDLTVRGAISIGRRLQDPLAELVKVEPKAVGVGQYQHDVHQGQLAEKLDLVILTCVNGVGVEVNTASAPLLSHVAGIRPAVAKNLVAHRAANGPFQKRSELLKVKALGPRAFEQAAGFLRIRGAKNPLDASAVHPERYTLVESMAEDLGVDLPDLVGNAGLSEMIELSRYVGDDVGELTLTDIVQELGKPGRDPRAKFEAPSFRDDVKTIDDVEEGMAFTGIVTNVTAFGAFVDIGVHQDGLVHISQLRNWYVKDPHLVVKAGETIRVRVLTVDLARKRIALTART